MTKHFVKIICILIYVSLTLTACGGGSSVKDASLEGVVVATPPTEYLGNRNPYDGDPDAELSGQKLYQANCSSCHGNQGEGDGVAAKSLKPSPTNLAITQAELGDDYLFWRIAEGGMFDPFNSSMPAWKTILDTDQLWVLISYMRTLNG